MLRRTDLLDYGKTLPRRLFGDGKTLPRQVLGERMNAMKYICITNRHLTKGDFLERLCMIAKSPVDQIILREKDLPEEDYAKLAAAVLGICPEMPKKLCLHGYPAVAADMHLPVQLPMPIFLEWAARGRSELPCGVSVHTPEEAIFAAKHGVRWLIAGHIFPTQCKMDVPARGLSFLQEVCQSVDIPVYAIGGITKARVALVQKAGAAGVCVMSAWAQCENPHQAIAGFVGG